jgi:cell division protein FtsL
VRGTRTFIVLWTLAVLAATSAFVLYLALRVRSVDLGYELGRSHARVARLREVKRVLELELSSHKSPERVELVARTLLGMSPPSADRIVFAGARPAEDDKPAAGDGTKPPAVAPAAPKTAGPEETAVDTESEDP